MEGYEARGYAVPKPAKLADWQVISLGDAHRETVGKGEIR